MTMSFLQSFSANMVVAVLPVLAFVISVFISRSGRPLSDRMVAALIFINVCLCRIPYIFNNVPLDPDEDIILTYGLNLLREPVIFDSIEPGTIGIIHSYVAMLVEWLRPVADYAYCALHLLSALLHSLSLLLLYLSLKRFFSYPAAIAGTAIGLLGLAFNTSFDFGHFNNEIESVVLLAWAVYLLSKLAGNPERRLADLAQLGLALGCVPYARLQGVPIAFTLAVWGFFLIYRGGGGRRRKWLMAITLILFGLAPTAVFLSVLGYNNLLTDFYFYYVKVNLVHGYKLSIFEQLSLFISEMPIQFQCAAGIIILLFTFSFRNITRHHLFPAIIFILISTYYSIIKSGSFFPHYYSYMVLFMTLGAGLGYSCLDTDRNKKLFQSIILLSCFISLTFSIKERMNQLSEVKFQEIQQGQAAQVILGFAQSVDDRLAVYGWYPILNIETGLASPTKDNHNFHMFFHPYRDEFERLYVADLKRFRPFVFVDSKIMWCGPFIPFQEKPLLAKYIQENYLFYRTVPASAYYDREPVDIYVSKERLLNLR